MSSGMVPTIGHTFSCDASLSALPVVVVPHYRSCLLAWYLTIDHACWSIATATEIFLVKRKWKKDGDGATCTVVHLYQTCLLIRYPLSDMSACTVQLNQTCMLGSFIQICEFVKCCSIREGIWSVTNPNDMPTCRVLLPRVCKTCRLPS